MPDENPTASPPTETTRRAAARVRRFLDARDGYFPIDVLAVVTRTGDRLLVSDLRELVEALSDRVAGEAEAPPARFEGFLVHLTTDPLCSQHCEPTTPAQRDTFDAARGAVCRVCADAADRAWADGYNHAKVETLTLPTGDPAGVVADEAYRAGYEDGLRDARRGSRSSGGRRRRDALTGNWITPRPTHKPFTDDGVTYCGWATDHGVIDGCGEVWPCSTVRARTECVTCSGRGVWMDELCNDCRGGDAGGDRP